MKVLVYGHYGWIGPKFIEVLEKNGVEYIRGNARVDNTKHLKDEILSIKPTHILATIGRTHGQINDRIYPTIDYLEQPGKLLDNVRDNLFSPLQIALICRQEGIHFTYLGTGCIFEYDQNHPQQSSTTFTEINKGFDETSLPNFFGSSYSIVKGITDRLMSDFESSALNLRIRMPITHELDNPRNFITKIINYEKICSVPNSMTVLNELIPYAVDMMIKGITGTVNLTNPGVISHNEILKMYRDTLDPEFTWKNFTVEEQDKILDARRSNNFLETKVLEKMYPQVNNIKVSVQNIFDELVISKKNGID